MGKHSGLKRLAIAIVALVSMGALMPASTAAAKARTTPKEVRGTWIVFVGDPGYAQIHMGKKSMWFSYGGTYHNRKWYRNGAHTVKLGKKVKKNKVFTLSKKDKAGYRTLRFKDSASAIDKLKIKKIKVHKKTRLRAKFYEQTHHDESKNLFKPSKHWLKKNNY